MTTGRRSVPVKVGSLMRIMIVLGELNGLFGASALRSGEVCGGEGSDGGSTVGCGSVDGDVAKPIAGEPFVGMEEADNGTGETEKDEETDEAEDKDVDVEDEVQVIELDGFGCGGRRGGSGSGEYDGHGD